MHIFCNIPCTSFLVGQTILTMSSYHPKMYLSDCSQLWVSEVFALRIYVPVNNFSVMSGRSHRFLGIKSTFWEVDVSCSRIQHGDPSEDRTPTSRSEVRRSTTRPPRLLVSEVIWLHEIYPTKSENDFDFCTYALLTFFSVTICATDLTDV